MQKCLNFNVYTCLAELVDFDADIVYDDVDCFIIEIFPVVFRLPTPPNRQKDKTLLETC